jgi:hypothetical protein
MHVAAVAVSLMVLLGSQQDSAERPSANRPKIVLNRRGTAARFEVQQLSSAERNALADARLTADQWSAIFAVYVGKERGNPPVLGSHQTANGVLRFEPRFPLKRGLHYRAIFNPAAIPGHGPDPLVCADFTLPTQQGGPATFVEHIYPSTGKLPENQLKFYLHFSAPMSQGEAYRHVSLLDASGKPVDLPFLELEQELWDRSGKRFTLFFDPGRIKRGLKPREEVGPALQEGKTYTLVIDSGWPDAQGSPLKATYRKPFTVGPPEDRPINVSEWRLQAPAAGTRQPLVVLFPRPLDHALLRRTLTVMWASGPVAGTLAIGGEEKCWEFTPKQPWAAGTYQLLVDKDLEDLAGNRVGQPFEIDVFRPVPTRLEQATLSFTLQ